MSTAITIACPKMESKNVLISQLLFQKFDFSSVILNHKIVIHKWKYHAPTSDANGTLDFCRMNKIATKSGVYTSSVSFLTPKNFRASGM
jgi:hypothetical protein